MDSNLYFKDKKFISASRAAEITGYTSDYIGQLSRAKKIKSKLVGKTRYVLESEIIDYKKNFSDRTKNKKSFTHVKNLKSQSATKNIIPDLFVDDKKYNSKISKVDGDKDFVNLPSLVSKDKSRLSEIGGSDKKALYRLNNISFEKTDLLPTLKKNFDLESLRYRTISNLNNKVKELRFKNKDGFGNFVKNTAFATTGVLLFLGLIFNLSDVKDASRSTAYSLRSLVPDTANGLSDLSDYAYFNLNKAVADSSFKFKKDFDFGSRPVSFTALSLGSIGDGFSLAGGWVRETAYKIVRPWFLEEGVTNTIIVEREKERTTSSPALPLVKGKGEEAQAKTVFMPASDRDYVDQKIEDLKIFFLTSPLAPNVNRYYVSKQNDVIADLVGRASTGSGSSGSSVSNLSDLADVSISSPPYGSILSYNGSDWINIATSSLGLPTFADIGVANFGKAWEVNSSGFLAPTTTISVYLGQASSTLLSSNQAWFGGTGTTTITNSGFIGQGTSSPFAQLSVNSEAGNTAFVVGSSTATSFIVDSTGKVGIGTSTPAATLTIQGGSHEKIRLLGNPSSATGNAAYMSFYPNNVDRWGYFGFTSNNSDFIELVNEKSGTIRRVVLDSAGKFGVGTSSPFARLGVNTEAGDIWGFAVGSSTKSLLSVSTEGFGTTTLSGLNISGQATTTSNVGFNITTGCYAIAGTCLSSGGSGASTTLLADSNTFSGTNNFTARLGLATSTPFAKLSVNSEAGEAAFVVGSSTATSLIVDSSGNVGIGKANPNSVLDVNGNIEISSTGGYIIKESASASLIMGMRTGTGTITGGYIQTFGNTWGTGQQRGGTQAVFDTRNGGTGGFGIFGYNGATWTNHLQIASPSGFVGISTTTPYYNLTVASTTGSQLALSVGAGISQWTFRNAGGNLYLSTTTVTGTATTSISALEIAGDGFGTTTVRGLNIIGQATTTSNVGFNITTGCYAIAGTCLSSGGSGASTTLLADSNTFSGTNNFTGSVGFSSSTPFARLSINANAGEAGLVVGSTTGTSFIVDRLGNVGIGGTTTPTSKLTVSYNAGSESSPGTPVGRFELRNNFGNGIYDVLSLDRVVTGDVGAASNGVGLLFNTENSAGSLVNSGRVSSILSTATAGSETSAITFQTRSTGNSLAEIMRIQGLGVGIATTSPFATLAVSSTIEGNRFVVGRDTGTEFIINDSGLVGIGTATPIFDLDIQKNSAGGVGIGITNETDSGSSGISLGETLTGNDYVSFFYNNSGNAGNLLTNRPNSSSIVTGDSATNGFSVSTISASAPIIFGTGGDALTNERIRITGLGYTGIGTTTPVNQLTIASSTAPQLSLSAGTGISQWTFRNAGGNLYLSTTTVAGTATSTESAFSINSDGGVRMSAYNCSGAGSLLQTDASGNLVCGTDDGGAGSMSIGGSITSATEGSVLFAGASGVLAQDNANFFWNDTTNRFGLGTTTPFAKLSVNSEAGEPAFVVGSSTRTDFIVNSIGNTGVGTTDPLSKLHIKGGTIIENGGIDSLNTQLIFTPTSVPSAYLHYIQTSHSSTVANNNSMSFFVSDLSSAGKNVMNLLGTGNVGIGTTTPFAQLQISSTTASATFKPQLALSDYSAGTNLKHWTLSSQGGNLYLSTSTDLYATSSISALEIAGDGFGTTTVRGLNISGQATTTSNVGMSITSGCYAIGNTCIGGGSGSMSIGGSITSATEGSVLFAGASGVLAQDNANFFWNDTTNRFGLGTTTPFAKLSVNSEAGEPAFVVGSSTRTDFIVDAKGNIGIGTTSPFAKVSIIGGGDNGTYPSFVVATTSTWNTNGSQAPMLYITATTTGALDYARVAIGTTTTPFGGNSGLRDQLTLAGRFYSTWRHMNCDAGGASQATALSADTAAACGDFAFDEDTTDTLTVVSGLGMPATRIATAATLTDAGVIRTGGNIGSASSSPVIEVLARQFAGHSTSSVKYIGFSGEALGGSYVQATAHINAIVFAASSTDNWLAIVRKNGAESRIDTGVASTSSALPFNRFRIEVSSSSAIFLINGAVVAVHSTATTNNIPNADMAAMVLVGTYTTGTPAARSLDLSFMRVWVDDPPGGRVAGVGELVGQQEFDPIQGADIAEAYLTDDPASFKEGMIVAEDLLGKVRLADEPYSRDILGSVSVSPHTVMGTETSSTTRVAMLGRVPVLVSLQNGPIKKGDRITSSPVSGIGMRASRPGYVIGNTLQEFDPDNGVGECIDNESYGLATTTCYGILLVKLNPGFDMGIGNVVQDVGDAVTGAAEAAQELLNDAFTKGAELTKIVAGRVIAQFAVVKNLFASVFTILPGGNITVPSGQDQISGWSELQSGTTTVFVNNAGVTEGSKIFITPRALVDSQLVVTEIMPGIGFKVETKVAPQSTIPFDWLIINSYGGTNAPNTSSNNTPNNATQENTDTGGEGNNIPTTVNEDETPGDNGNTDSTNVPEETGNTEQTPEENNTPTTEEVPVPENLTEEVVTENNPPEEPPVEENNPAPTTEQTP